MLTLYIERDGGATHKVPSANIVSRHRKNLPHNGNNAPNDNMEAALLRPTTMPGIHYGKDPGKEVWGRGKEKCFHFGVAKGLDDRRKEI